MTGHQGTIGAGTGRAVRLGQGESIDIINTHGNQVVDMWALDETDPTEYFSVEHTKAELLKLIPAAGDDLYTNRRNTLLAFVSDTSPGRHDMQMPCCDPDRYRVLGVVGHHRNCRDNFLTAVQHLGITAARVPNPFNLFQNMPWTQTGQLSFTAPVSRPGDTVTFRAVRDAVVVMSACPQDLLPVNGTAQRPTDVEFRIHPATTAAVGL
jgi:uncharacterized protein YcgI (DUF1989 family)